MKQRIIFIFFFCLLIQTSTYAYDFMSGGLAYNILKDGTVSVTYKNPKVENSADDGGYSSNIVIPSSVKYKGRTYKVTEIGKKAFYNSKKLLSVKMPEGIRKIDFLSFGLLRNLKKIYIPASVSKIVPGFTFQTSSLNIIVVSPKNKYYTSKNNCIYNKQMTRLLLVSPKTRKYTFPSSVKIVDDYAFNCVKMAKLVIPKTLTTIGGRAFYFCDIKKIDNKASLKHLPGSENYNRNLELPYWAY